MRERICPLKLDVRQDRLDIIDSMIEDDNRQTLAARWAVHELVHERLGPSLRAQPDRHAGGAGGHARDLGVSRRAVREARPCIGL